MEGKPRQLELEGAGHITSTIKKQRASAAQLPSSMYTDQDPTWGMALPTVGMSSHLN